MNDLEFLSIKNWDRYQHYKRRNPPWVKLHVELASDYDFLRLPDADKLHLFASMVLAARYQNKIPADAIFLQQQMHLSEPFRIQSLIDSGWLCKHGASEVLAECEQSAMPETETETETETDKKPPVTPLPEKPAEKTPEPKAKPEPLEKPENLNLAAWAEWDDFRQSSAKLRKGWSDAGKRKAMNLLAKHSATGQQALVDYSIQAGYTGLFPDQLTKGQPRNGTPAAPAALAASHKPFTEPPKQTQADKAKAKADLDRMQAQIAARQAPDHKRKQIAACRFPANLSKLCRHYGWGDPPAGLEFTDAKTWAIKQAEREA